MNVEQLFFHRGLRSQPSIVSYSKLNICSVDVCMSEHQWINVRACQAFAMLCVTIVD